MVPEFGLDRAYDLAFFRIERSLVELRDEGALPLATQVAAVFLAHRVLRILTSELFEVPPIFEFTFGALGLILLILGKKYVPYAPLLGGREPGPFILLVKVLDFLLRRLELTHGLISDLLDEK